MNLATWLYYLSALPRIISNFKYSQIVILNQQHNYEIYHATVDNLINNIHSFTYAMGYAENEVFHLSKILKEEDWVNFFKVIDKEVARHNKSYHWEVVSKDNLNVKIIKSIWLFKCK